MQVCVELRRLRQEHRLGSLGVEASLGPMARSFHKKQRNVMTFTAAGLNLEARNRGDPSGCIHVKSPERAHLQRRECRVWVPGLGRGGRDRS